MKSLIKKIIPEKIFLLYHLLLAVLAATLYGNPSKKMVVIGVVGTKGKTSTANYLWAALRGAGLKVGLMGTANIRIGDKEIPNTYHMTMPGRFILQGLLRKIADAGCTHMVLEMTSEGIKQYRHKGVYYDVLIFTNLFPEHLPSHGGSFEKYKEAKGTVFKELKTLPVKKIAGKLVPKVVVANNDSEYAPYFLSFPADRKITFSVDTPSDIRAQNISVTEKGTTFRVKEVEFFTPIPGVFNTYNILGAIAVAGALGLDVEKAKDGIAELEVIPGRMERIVEGQPFVVIVDYAHEKQSMGLLLRTAEEMKKGSLKKTIVLFGAEGGGRDKSKRRSMGLLAGKLADYVVVSNVDPYDDEPQEIIADILRATEEEGKIVGENLFPIEDRREGIRKALSLAKEGDIVLISGKGSEQSMIIKGDQVPWDDRVVVREELEKLGYKLSLIHI